MELSLDWRRVLTTRKWYRAKLRHLYTVIHRHICMQEKSWTWLEKVGSKTSERERKNAEEDTLKIERWRDATNNELYQQTKGVGEFIKKRRLHRHLLGMDRGRLTKRVFGFFRLRKTAEMIFGSEKWCVQNGTKRNSHNKHR